MVWYGEDEVYTRKFKFRVKKVLRDRLRDGSLRITVYEL